jgi:chromosome partitioning protein
LGIPEAEVEARTTDAASNQAAAPPIVAFANQKGGVGKTTTAVSTAVLLARRGYRVLLVDVDPQGNATSSLGVEKPLLLHTIYDVLVDELPIGQAVAVTDRRNLDLVPATAALAGAEVELVSAGGRETKLAAAVDGVTDRFELAFLDCPPSLGLLTINACAAADDLIVPIQCEYYALEGLGQLLETAERVRDGINPNLRVAGFLLTMYDARTKLAGQVAEDVRRHFGRRVFDTVIPRSVRLSEAPSFGEPALTLDASARGAVAYRLLAQEVEALYGLEVNRPPPPDDVVRSGGEHASSSATPGPGGRGYGVTTQKPEGIEHAWPARDPYSQTTSRKEEFSR